MGTSRAEEYEEHLRQRSALSRTSMRYMDPRLIDASLNALRSYAPPLSGPPPLRQNGGESAQRSVNLSQDVLPSAELVLGFSRDGRKSGGIHVKSSQDGVESAEIQAKFQKSLESRAPPAKGQNAGTVVCSKANDGPVSRGPIPSDRGGAANGEQDGPCFVPAVQRDAASAAVQGKGPLGGNGVTVPPAAAGTTLGTYRSRGNMQMAGSVSGSRTGVGSGAGYVTLNGAPRGAVQEGNLGRLVPGGGEGQGTNKVGGSLSEAVKEGNETSATSRMSAVPGDGCNAAAGGSGAGSPRAGPAVLDVERDPGRVGSRHAGAGPTGGPPEGDPLLAGAGRGSGALPSERSSSFHWPQGAHMGQLENKGGRRARHKKLREWTSGRRPSFVERLETKQWEMGPEDYEIVVPLRELAEKVMAEKAAMGQVAGGTDDKVAVQSPETGELFLLPPFPPVFPQLSPCQQ